MRNISIECYEMGRGDQWKEWRIEDTFCNARAFAKLAKLSVGNNDGKLVVQLGTPTWGVVYQDGLSEFAVSQTFRESPMLPISITSSIAKLMFGGERLALENLEVYLAWRKRHLDAENNALYHVFYRGFPSGIQEESWDHFGKLFIGGGDTTLDVVDLVNRVV